ncbi:helix-turn-helix domain-containing protein [Kribbella sp. NBC_00382]|uniref:helix-turn-helix domain-containing protein n=1 Tax=Kribbella sp. NBC_00382 TaxID=2975967 RepID=UPI002E23B491
MTEAVPGGGAEFARVRLRTTIRKYRASAMLTQKEVAGELGWSVSKLLRLEQGASPITPSGIRALMSLYGVTDPAVIESQVEMAKQARGPMIYEAISSEIATREYQELMGLETGAKVIYKYEPAVIPGLFQTEDYASNLSQALKLSPEQIEGQVELRMLRQANVLESTPRPELNFILEEAALCRKIGTNEVMLEQLDHLLERAKESDISLSMLPLAAGAHPRMGTAFTILQFDDDDLPDTLYREGANIETISIDKPDEVQYYRELFAELHKRAGDFPSFSDQLVDIRRQRFSRTEQEVD